MEVLPASPEAVMASLPVADIGRWARDVAAQAQHALAQEDDVETVRELSRRAEAFVAYLGARTEEGRQLGVVRMWAERRLGELLALMAERGERAQSGGARDVPWRRIVDGDDYAMPPSGGPPPLKALGVSKDQSSRAQRLAKVPAEDVERITAEQVATPGSVTPASVLRQAENEQRRRAEHEANPPDPAVVAEGIAEGEALRLERRQREGVQRWVDLVRKMVETTPEPEAVVAVAGKLDQHSPIPISERWMADLDAAAAALAEVRQRLSRSLA